jgi:hypothetical protein
MRQLSSFQRRSLPKSVRLTVEGRASRKQLQTAMIASWVFSLLSLSHQWTMPRSSSLTLSRRHTRMHRTCSAWSKPKSQSSLRKTFPMFSRSNRYSHLRSCGAWFAAPTHFSESMIQCQTCLDSRHFHHLKNWRLHWIRTSKSGAKFATCPLQCHFKSRRPICIWCLVKSAKWMNRKRASIGRRGPLPCWRRRRPLWCASLITSQTTWSNQESRYN